MMYILKLTAADVDYVIRRLREVDPGHADNPKHVMNKAVAQTGRNPETNTVRAARATRYYIDKISGRPA